MSFNGASILLLFFKAKHVRNWLYTTRIQKTVTKKKPPSETTEENYLNGFCQQNIPAVKYNLHLLLQPYGEQFAMYYSLSLFSLVFCGVTIIFGLNYHSSQSVKAEDPLHL